MPFLLSRFSVFLLEAIDSLDAIDDKIVYCVSVIHLTVQQAQTFGPLLNNFRRVFREENETKRKAIYVQ